MKGYRSVRVAGAIFRLLLTLLILAVVGIVIWRVFFSTNIPGEVKYLQPNDTLSSAYAANGGNLTFRRQEQRRQSHEFSYQAAHPPPDDAFDALRARLLLHDLFLLADKEQALLIRHRLHGCSLAETARREGMSIKRVRRRLKALYRAYFTQKENKQKEL